jgi:hypothetical protein
MKRLLGWVAVFLVLIGAIPQELKAAGETCMWWWTHSIIEYNTITGEHTETHYFKKVCFPDTPY